MKLDQYKNFEVNVYGDVTPYNDTISKARVRIFYRGLNRNGSFINDEFAEKLINSLPYAPVKGIYDDVQEDYTDHGTERTQGRAYGVVMGPNEIEFAWEPHLDEDGVEREYACANVLLWTSLYEEAKEIPGKSQSMELYEPSIQGYVKTIDGRRVFEFTDACFLGLQALGEDVEPCFEGSSFFSLYDKLFEETDPKDEGEKQMLKNFRLSANEKAQQIWELLNPYVEGEEGWVINYAITDVYDDCVVVYDYEHPGYIKINYSVENDQIVLGEREACYVDYLTAEERDNVAEMRKKCSENELKIEELNSTISTLNTEKENFELQLTEAAQFKAQAEAELEGLEALKQFKYNTELKEKQTVIANYSNMLNESILKNYSDNIDNYTADALEKELAFELVKSNPTIFTQSAPLLPKDEPKSGLEAILAKYQK